MQGRDFSIRSHAVNIDVNLILAFGIDGSKFYVFGGRQGMSKSKSACSYGWYIRARAKCLTTLWMIIGGNGLSAGKAFVQIYTPESNSWYFDQTLPSPRTGLGKAPYLGKSTTDAGSPDPSLDSCMLRGRVLRYWRRGSLTRGPCNCWYLQSRCKIPQTPVSINQCESVVLQTKEWRNGPPLPQPMHGTYPVVHGKRLLLAGMTSWLSTRSVCALAYCICRRMPADWSFCKQDLPHLWAILTPCWVRRFAQGKSINTFCHQ